MKKKFKILHLLAAVFFAGNLFAQHSDEKSELEYDRMINLRAEKILKELNMKDSLQYKKVRSIIVKQYKHVNLVEHVSADAKKAGDTITVHQSDEQLRKFHKSYVQDLEAELDKQQIEKIKDGMTYSVLPVTYKAYQDMIPSLKSDEKKQILSWLTEARELAMDQGSSDKKHQVFGKYKGRINNYLSARGYDLQKERKAWEERIKQQKSNG